jgi:hypothetical protein
MLRCTNEINAVFGSREVRETADYFFDSEVEPASALRALSLFALTGQSVEI